MKCFINRSMLASIIHPDLFAVPAHPIGPPWFVILKKLHFNFWYYWTGEIKVNSGPYVCGTFNLRLDDEATATSNVTLFVFKRFTSFNRRTVCWSGRSLCFSMLIKSCSFFSKGNALKSSNAPCRSTFVAKWMRLCTLNEINLAPYSLRLTFTNSRKRLSAYGAWSRHIVFCSNNLIATCSKMKWS